MLCCTKQTTILKTITIPQDDLFMQTRKFAKGVHLLRISIGKMTAVFRVMRSVKRGLPSQCSKEKAQMIIKVKHFHNVTSAI
ncbi:hypothetical protein C4F40_00150 [Sphingobacterium sp. Ka21]|uniref:Uncharacterized protein n=1 Tax=Sphingobacterium pedocola TaxID=2082722 RepID=A0ABR9T2N2_9SPHI|nr:hypothetical protein [Sphingobacterium pedocola]